MATIQSVINDLEALIASLKLKLNDEMGIAIPVAEPVEVVVYATPVEDDLPLAKIVSKREWTDLPDDILSYIGTFFDVKKKEAKLRYKTYLKLYQTINSAPLEVRWKEYATSITKKGVILNEAGQKQLRQKTISMGAEWTRWEGYVANKYKMRLLKMMKRYKDKYWRGDKPFKNIDGKMDTFIPDTYYWRSLPTEWDDENPDEWGEVHRIRYYAPLNVVGGQYKY
jgi:hypothetical protein